LRALSDEELEQISDLAVETAETYIFSRVSKKEILDMNINANITYDEVLNVEVLVDIDLDELSTIDEKELAENAVEAALTRLDSFVDDNFQ
jgi:Protein of unknown function (DUF3194)